MWNSQLELRLSWELSVMRAALMLASVRSRVCEAAVVHLLPALPRETEEVVLFSDEGKTEQPSALSAPRWVIGWSSGRPLEGRSAWMQAAITGARFLKLLTTALGRPRERCMSGEAPPSRQRSAASVSPTGLSFTSRRPTSVCHNEDNGEEEERQGACVVGLLAVSAVRAELARCDIASKARQCLSFRVRAGVGEQF